MGDDAAYDLGRMGERGKDYRADSGDRNANWRTMYTARSAQERADTGVEGRESVAGIQRAGAKERSDAQIEFWERKVNTQEKADAVLEFQAIAQETVAKRLVMDQKYRDDLQSNDPGRISRARNAEYQQVDAMVKRLWENYEERMGFTDEKRKSNRKGGPIIVPTGGGGR
jgi:hypothetical protein